ncbi:MAG: AAA family ATPase [Acidimicrobiia bacterium]
MNLRQLLVRNFRGIQHLNWVPNGQAICLVGSGDATKTTILDAIEWCLSPRWSLPISDADFHGVVVNQPIVIEATVGEVPAALLSDQKYGLDQRGWGPDGLRDEPADDDESVLTIRLTIDDSLEPLWEVVNDRQPEPRRVSARDREALGATRVGSDVERHLTWGRGSALLRMTGSTDEMERTLADAHRTARQTVNKADLAALVEASQVASEAATDLGAGRRDTYSPALDPGAMGMGAAALGLHEGAIPVRAAGLGSRRLAALAVQRRSFREGAIVLIDEIEAGLEPHRLRHLLRTLRAGESGQVLMTTHSPITVVELPCQHLRVVISDGATTTVQELPGELQAAVRAAPEALLGRRVIVCEGKTEVGLCRALDLSWTEARGVPPADRGVVVVPGEGTSAPRTALAFASLRYPTALLADSDVANDPDEAALAAGDVKAFIWEGEASTEERVALDVPWDVLMAIVDRARELFDEDVPEAATNAIATRLGADQGTGPEEWREGGFGEAEIRAAIGRTAKSARWFKRTDLGEILGRIVVDALPRMPDTDLATKLDGLADWAYDP